MRSRLNFKEYARSRSKKYLEGEIEKAQGVMKGEIALQGGWMRAAFEAGLLEADVPLSSMLDTAEAQIDMLKEQLQAEREARLQAERRAATATQFPVFVNFPSRKGPDIRVRLDQISAVTSDKIYLVTDDVPFADMQDPREVIDAITLEITKAMNEATAPARIIVPEKKGKV